jgi:hypothetical protein
VTGTPLITGPAGGPLPPPQSPVTPEGAFRARGVPDGLLRCHCSALAGLPTASAMSLSRSDVRC